MGERWREKRGGSEVGQFQSPFPPCSGWVRQSQTHLLTALQRCKAGRMKGVATSSTMYVSMSRCVQMCV